MIPAHKPHDELAAKLAAFDENADRAVEYLVAWLHWHKDYLIAIARGRHAWGHYRYKDALLYEYSEGQLEAEAAEELADAVVYVCRLLAIQGHS